MSGYYRIIDKNREGEEVFCVVSPNGIFEQMYVNSIIVMIKSGTRRSFNISYIL